MPVARRVVTTALALLVGGTLLLTSSPADAAPANPGARGASAQSASPHAAKLAKGRSSARNAARPTVHPIPGNGAVEHPAQGLKPTPPGQVGRTKHAARAAEKSHATGRSQAAGKPHATGKSHATGRSHAPGQLKRAAGSSAAAVIAAAAPVVSGSTPSPASAHRPAHPKRAAVPSPPAATPPAPAVPGPLQKIITGLARLSHWSPLRGPLGWLLLGVTVLALAMITTAFATGRGAALAGWRRRLTGAE